MFTRAQKSCCDNAHNELTCTVVPEKERINFLPKHFGILSFQFESKVYGWMAFLTSDYRGGCWEFFRLSNGGLYIAPKRDTSFHVLNPGNYFEGELSADGAGIGACLFALSSLCFDYPKKDVFAERFHQLRAFALNHAEAVQIIRLID